jgi:intracellular multiplication protein IcmT
MAHWRDTYRPARFFFMDARAGIPTLMTLLHVRYWTVTIAVLVVIVFYWFERLGVDASGAVRAFRAWIIGDLRPARTFHKVRAPVDYERRPVP